MARLYNRPLNQTVGDLVVEKSLLLMGRAKGEVTLITLAISH